MIKKNKTILFLMCLILCSKSASASFLWNIQDGINFYYKNNIQEAIKFFKTYEKYNLNDKRTYFWLAKTYMKSQNEQENKNLSQQSLKKFYQLYSSEKNIEKISYEPINSQQIEDYFDMAIMYFEDGNFFEANYYADLILKINPKSASAYFIKAKLAQLEKKDELAKKYLNKAIALNNDILRTNLAKSLNIYSLPELTKEIYLTFANEAYFYLDMSNAVKNARKYIELDKTNSSVYLLLAEAYLGLDNISYAKNVLFEAQTLFPNNLQLKLLEAQIADLENNIERKEDALKTAYEINPNNKQVLYEMSNLYIQKKDFLRANEYSKTLIVIDDGMYEAYFNYVLTSIKIGDIDSALYQIRKLSELNQNKSELNYLLALICEYQGDFNNAKEYLLQALKEDVNPNYYLELAKIEYLNKDFYNSEKYLFEGLKIATTNEVRQQIEDYLVKIYLKTNNRKGANNLLNKKYSLDKNRIIYKYNLYVLNKLEGNDKTNIKLKQIIKIKPSSAIDVLDLSEIYFEENNLSEAIKIVDKAIKKYPYNGELYLQKIKFYYLENHQENIKKIILEMKKNFNSPQG